MLLSPDVDTRQRALEAFLLAEVGPTGLVDPAYWRQQLEKGPLDDENMEKLTDEFEDSTILHLGRISARHCDRRSRQASPSTNITGVLGSPLRSATGSQ